MTLKRPSIIERQMFQKAGRQAHCKLLKISTHKRRLEVFQKVWVLESREPMIVAIYGVLCWHPATYWGIIFVAGSVAVEAGTPRSGHAANIDP
jgi:hypothetical protein